MEAKRAPTNSDGSNLQSEYEEHLNTLIDLVGIMGVLRQENTPEQMKERTRSIGAQMLVKLRNDPRFAEQLKDIEQASAHKTTTKSSASPSTSNPTMGRQQNIPTSRTPNKPMYKKSNPNGYIEEDEAV